MSFAVSSTSMGIPLALDPKKPLRRTLLPGYLVIAGLPHAPPYVSDAGADTPEQIVEDVLA